MALVAFILGIGFFGLNLVAFYKIITKAGYSGNWILLVLAPFVAYLIGLVVLVHDVRSRSFHPGNFVDWFGLAAFLALIEYIFFLVFAFSEWPALRQRSQNYPPGYRYGWPAPPPPLGTGRGTPRPVAGSRLAPGQPRSWPDIRGGSPSAQSGDWPDPSDRSRDQPSAPRGPQSPTTGESEGSP